MSENDSQIEKQKKINELNQLLIEEKKKQAKLQTMRAKVEVAETEMNEREEKRQKQIDIQKALNELKKLR
jgi:hypothetical protein